MICFQVAIWMKHKGSRRDRPGNIWMQCALGKVAQYERRLQGRGEASVAKEEFWWKSDQRGNGLEVGEVKTVRSFRPWWRLVFALSGMRSYWNVLSRGVRESDLCFNWIILAAVWKPVGQSGVWVHNYSQSVASFFPWTGIIHSYFLAIWYAVPDCRSIPGSPLSPLFTIYPVVTLGPCSQLWFSGMCADRTWSSP